MQYPAARPLPPLCPGGHPLGIGGHNLMTLCSGHGECDERTGTCACAAGRNGTACELLLCEADCSGRGVCRNGTCECAAGWAAPACASRRCVADCSGHGTCGADGACRCEAGWSGPPSAPCSVQGTGCPNGCSHHGRCVQAPPISPTSPCISPVSPLYLPCISHHDRCVQGNCACHHGYVGRDCAQARPQPLPPLHPFRPFPPSTRATSTLPPLQPRADAHEPGAAPRRPVPPSHRPVPPSHCSR